MRQPFRHRMHAWALTVAFTLTAQAADGVIEINQAIVEANDGFPYVISEPGSYVLTGNLTVPDENTTAILVQADHVTVDLNGFAIIGPVQCAAEDGSVSCSPDGTGIGVDAFESDSVGTVVRNGTVRGMGFTGVTACPRSRLCRHARRKPSRWVTGKESSPSRARPAAP